jgi:SOS-response transcriptional repressor LexA
MNKTAFIISIALTTFILIGVGGIAYAVQASSRIQATSIPATAAPQTASESVDQQALQQAINDREAAYQQMIAEANTRLEQAQQQQQALEAQLTALQAQSSTPTAEPQAAGITPEDAAAIASKYWGQTSIYSVEVVSVKGENMYQVTFSSGDLVFVDVNGQVTGAITAKQLASLNVQSSSHGFSDGEHEYEGNDD